VSLVVEDLFDAICSTRSGPERPASSFGVTAPL